MKWRVTIFFGKRCKEMESAGKMNEQVSERRQREPPKMQVIAQRERERRKMLHM